MQTTLWKRGLFSSRNSLCCTIFCASKYQAAAELNGIILISMDNLIIPGGLKAKQLQTHAAEWNVPEINWIWLNFSFNGWRKRNRPKMASNFLANLELWVMAVEHQVPLCITWGRCCSGCRGTRTQFLITILFVLTFSFSEREDENFDSQIAVLMLPCFH